MLTLLFFEPADGPPTPFADLEHVVSGIPGIELTPADRDGYRPGSWRDPVTGASCLIDLGLPPIEIDTMHPPTAYAGWRDVHLAVHIPLSAPHWHCVEALAVAEHVLAQLPHLRALDTEDTRHADQDQAGPSDWDRLRVLASWEQLHAAQSAGRLDLPRMERRASLALWRYRRERARGQAAHPALTWPEALVLLDSDSTPPQARSAALWLDPTRPLALPPVELVVIRRGEAGGVLPADELLTAAQGGQRLGDTFAIEIPADQRLDDLFKRARLLPATRFTTLRDGDWSD